jgi:hypothetical protein
MNAVRCLAALFALSLALSCLNGGGSPSWPGPHSGRAIEILLPRSGAARTDDAVVRDLPVCIAAQSWSAGELGRSILYHFQRKGRTLTVGYFVYWTTERPWGNNVLSYAVLPAMFIDAFYSHFFFLFPGAQRLIHGPGDIEGARVVYQQQDDGRWTPVSAVADDGMHREVPLSPGDFVDRDGRVVLLTDVWSHQLGAPGARSFTENGRQKMACFGREAMQPLTDEITRIFRLGSPDDPRRAPPAWRLGPPIARLASAPTPDQLPDLMP